MTRQLRIDHGPSLLGGWGRTAGLAATLAIEEDGCFYAKAGTEGSALIWPRDYEARLSADGLVEIVDIAGRVVLREGDRFSTGGGGLPDDDQRVEVRHAREVHGREVFVIQHPVLRLG